MILTVSHSIMDSVELLKRQDNQIIEDLITQFIILLFIPRLEEILPFNEIFFLFLLDWIYSSKIFYTR
jgi:hypothetical protein